MSNDYKKGWFDWFMQAAICAMVIMLILLATLPFWPTK